MQNNKEQRVEEYRIAISDVTDEQDLWAVERLDIDKVNTVDLAVSGKTDTQTLAVSGKTDTQTLAVSGKTDTQTLAVSGDVTIKGSTTVNNLTSTDITLKAAQPGEERSITFTMADNDTAHIKVGGNSDAGYLEIATTDNKNEPIYLKQYDTSGGFREAILLDASGNTSFPGTVNANGDKKLATEELVNNKEKDLSSRVNTNQASISNHTGNKSNPHGVTKAQVGLGNVNNTSDENKPLSKAARDALADVAYGTGSLTDWTSDETSKGTTPAGVKKCVVKYAVLKEGDSTINGTLTAKTVVANSMTINQDSSINSLKTNTLYVGSDSLNFSDQSNKTFKSYIEELRKSDSDNATAAQKAQTTADSKLDKNATAQRAYVVSNYADMYADIEIGFSGDGLTADTSDYFAMYKAGSNENPKIKDASFNEVRKIIFEKNNDVVQIPREGSTDQLYILKRASLSNGMGFSVKKGTSWMEYKLPNNPGTFWNNGNLSFEYNDSTRTLNIITK